jgi:hypothetical protein
MNVLKLKVQFFPANVIQKYTLENITTLLSANKTTDFTKLMGMLADWGAPQDEFVV